ncbi:UPF0528 protein Y75B8A.31 [Diplonema papillatum]|nr:UPF0528 protein Y75B8A.31 [Diplonema papillatum]
MAAALAELGYEYVPAETEGREYDYVLRRKDDKSKGFAWSGQEDYDRLGDAVTAYLVDTMTGVYGMEKRGLGPGTDGEESFVYTKDLDKSVICVLIQGSGAVTPGMWARSLCINDSLHEGTVFPYVKEALRRGWGVVVADPNAAANECAEKHVNTLFKQVVEPTDAKRVVVVAHSYGGCSSLYYLKTTTQANRDRIACLALTDSVHKLQNTVLTDAQAASAADPAKAAEKQKEQSELRRLVPEAFEPPSAEVSRFLAEKARNWVKSERPLDHPEEAAEGTPCVSAGTADHVWTSGVAFPSVFAFLDASLPARPKLWAEKIAEARAAKDRGNARAREGACKRACVEYKTALIWLKALTDDGSGGDDQGMGMIADQAMKKKDDALPKLPADVQEGVALKLSIQNNLAQMRLKLEDWEGAKAYANAVIDAEPDNTKALFRRGQAFLNLKFFDDALRDFDKVGETLPKLVAPYMQSIQQGLKKQTEKEKKAYSGMFQ